MRLKRIQVELGVQICGGNLYGVFVESLDEDSPAKSPDGLLPGDLLLEVLYQQCLSISAVQHGQWVSTDSALGCSSDDLWVLRPPNDCRSNWTKAKKYFSSQRLYKEKWNFSLLCNCFFVHCLFDFYWKWWVILCWQLSSVSCCQPCNWCFPNSTMASAWRIKQKRRPTWKCWNQLKQSRSRCRTVWIALMWSKSPPEMDFL